MCLLLFYCPKHVQKKFCVDGQVTPIQKILTFKCKVIKVIQLLALKYWYLANFHKLIKKYQLQRF